MEGAEGDIKPVNLDELVARVAKTLLGVESDTLRATSESVLRVLVTYFEVDLSFLRFHDTDVRSTRLVAEWPPRAEVPDPDPLGLIFFADADPSFAATEHLADILLVRPDTASKEYQERVQDASGVAASSVATVPLRSGERTTGLLGFVKFGDRGWDDDEVRALRTIGLLFAQMQARLIAGNKLRYLAHHDELTGLPNRRDLLVRLEAALAEADDEPRALLFVDLDRLKAMNDFLGHDAGDRFIVAVAERLRGSVGPEDMVARLGGDEFVVAVEGPAGEERALALAARIQEAVSEPIRLGGQTLGRTVSIGVALARSSETSVAEWLRNADQAVLAAKKRGGNTVVAFNADMAAHEQVRVAVEMNLQAAIRAGLLTIHFQPVVDLRTRATLGVEALLRWNHPTLGPIPPELFVGVAEATNMAGELGEWVLDEACRQFAHWREVLTELATSKFTLAVNVSPVQLITVDFVNTVARILVRHGLSGADLTLEVTEQAVVSDMAAALTTLRGLRQLGVSVAIDDFGTGYSSLAQLKALPVTTLKIDRVFIGELGVSTDDLVIVRSIVGLADAFGLDLVAEGVETEVAAQTLLAAGCTVGQGHLFSRPVAAEAVLDYLAASVASAASLG